MAPLEEQVRLCNHARQVNPSRGRVHGHGERPGDALRPNLLAHPPGVRVVNLAHRVPGEASAV
eukprot:3464372-Heterocapsa_arctica.AAC.1